MVPKYIIKTPVYQYAKSYYHIDVLDGRYEGLQFNFSKIEIINDGEDKKLSFQYNLLSIPQEIEVDEELEQVVSDILQHIIERGYYDN